MAAQLVRGSLVLIVLSVGLTLVGGSTVFAFSGAADRLRGVAILIAAAGSGVLMLIGGVGLWMGRRWAARLVAGIAAANTAWLAVAMSGFALRAVRLSIGVGVVPFLAGATAALAVTSVWLAGQTRADAPGPMTSRGSALVGAVAYVLVAVAFWVTLIGSGPDGITPVSAGVIAAVAASVPAMGAAVAAQLWIDAAYRPWSVVVGGLALVLAATLLVIAAPFFGVLFENVAQDCPFGDSGCL